MRLYILLKEYQKIGSRTFEVAELQELLQVGKSLKGYNQFKVNVLNKAIKEINKTDLYIELTESKKERKKVIEITFKIQSANKAMTTEILQSYIGRDIQIKGEITKITEAYAEDGNIYIFVMLKGDDTTPKKTLVSIDTKDKFFHALEMAERQGKLF
jgi:plasmid replication initiation protein